MLTGIRFISKNDRPVKESLKEIEKDKEKKSEKKRKHKKEHKHKHNKQKNRKRERHSHSSHRDRSSSSSDSGEEDQEEDNFNLNEAEEMMKEVAEEEERKEMSIKKQKILKEEEGDEDDHPVIVSDTEGNNEIYEERPAIVQNLSTNQGIASLLRSRLKNPSSTPSAPLLESKPSNSQHAPDLSFMSKEDLRFMSSYTRRNNAQPIENAKPSSFQILDLDTGDDIDSVLVSNIIKKGANFKGTELGLSSVSMSREGIGSNGDRAGMDEGNENGEGELDMRMLVSKEKKLTDEQLAKRIVQKAERASKFYTQIVENCHRCRVSRFYQSYRTICSGNHVELRIKPVTYSLDPEWHCEIVPIPHTPSILRCLDTDLDGEDGQGILREIDRFKTSLSSMFERDGKGVAFMETAIHAGIGNSDESGVSTRISKHHTVIDVVPFENGMQGEISMFFHQAFQNSGEDWSTHKTRIITLNSTRPLSKAIPSRFPYIAVEWSTESNGKHSSREGMAHVVEDPSHFTNSFCLDVIAGALDIDPFILRKLSKNKNHQDSIEGHREDEAKERRNVERFRNSWGEFDWTR